VPEYMVPVNDKDGGIAADAEWERWTARELRRGGGEQKPVERGVPMEEVIAGFGVIVLGCDRGGSGGEFFLNWAGHSLLRAGGIAAAGGVSSGGDLADVVRGADGGGTGGTDRQMQRESRVLVAPPDGGSARGIAVCFVVCAKRLWFLDQRHPGSVLTTLTRGAG